MNSNLTWQVARIYYQFVVRSHFKILILVAYNSVDFNWLGWSFLSQVFALVWILFLFIDF